MSSQLSHESEKSRVHSRWALTIIILMLGVSAILLLSYKSREQTESNEALFEAIERGNHLRVAALVLSGASVNARRRSNPPVFWEPLLNLQTRIEYPHYPFQIGYTPLMTASIRGDVWTANYLLNQGADVQAVECDHVGPTALELAVEYEHPNVALLLMNRGADPNGVPGAYGPMLEAWRGHDRAMIDLLLHHGAKPLPATLKAPITPRL